jgi:hypothetical protein
MRSGQVGPAAFASFTKGFADDEEEEHAMREARRAEEKRQRERERAGGRPSRGDTRPTR